MDYGRAKNYLQREVADQEDIKALVDLLGSIEGLEAEVKARETSIEKAKAEYAVIQSQIEKHLANEIATHDSVQASIGKVREQYEFAAQQAEQDSLERINVAAREAQVEIHLFENRVKAAQAKAEAAEKAADEAQAKVDAANLVLDGVRAKLGA